MITPKEMVLDLGNLDPSATDFADVIKSCTDQRQAPLVPETFTDILRTKTFTNGSDFDIVTEKYGEVSRSIFLSVRILQLDHLGWANEDADKLASSLLMMPALKSLALNGNKIGDHGAQHIFKNLA